MGTRGYSNQGLSKTAVTMKFSSRKDALFAGTILCVNTLLIGIAINILLFSQFNAESIFALILILANVGLLFWMFFGTRYTLSEDGHLSYRSGPVHGKIAVSRIREIQKGKTLWVGLRPATARKGLILKYDRFNEIYISPKTNDTFIAEILLLNPGITIT